MKFCDFVFNIGVAFGVLGDLILTAVFLIIILIIIKGGKK